MSTSKLLRVCGSLCCAALLLGVVSVSAAHSATVTTNRYDYVPGQTVVVTGSGYLAGETVTITLQESPNIDTHGPYTSVADGSGSFVNSSFVTNAADVGVTFTLTATGQTSGRSAQTTFVDANEASNLDQARNGTPAMPTSPVDFQDGNAGASNSHYIESHSIPYRIEFTNSAEKTHGLDDPDPGRDLHRPRDQRLSASRILTLDFLVLGPRPTRA